MSGKLVCPVCSKSVSTNPLKSWKFGKYDVKRYECPNRKTKINFYKGEERSFTIPKSK